MRKLSTLGLTMGLLSLAPTARAAQLTLAFDAFIPTPRVTNPVAEVLPPFFTEFIGDDRGFDVDATLNGEARLFTQVVLDTAASEPLVSTFSGAGTTIGFLVQDGEETSQSAQTTPISTVAATRISETEIFLQVAARATNPLIANFLPPEIAVPPAEYVYDITLMLLDGAISYDLSGTNRAFPNYSVFLERTPLLLNPANGEDSQLLAVIEPVSAEGVVAIDATPVDEPGLSLALGIVSVGFLAQRSLNKRAYRLDQRNEAA